ncbi:MAG: N-acetylmuramoyl-L-alanine amidase [Bacteroidota bacterium]
MKATLFLLLSCFLAIQFGFCQEKTVVAQSGDGIYSLLRKGGINPSSKTVDEFRKLNADKIGKDNRVFIGKSYIIPFTKQVEEVADTIAVENPVMADSVQLDSVQLHDVVENPIDQLIADSTDQSSAPEKQYIYIPIFGPEHEEVEMVSEQLVGNCYYLISGHGGPDPGALGKYQKKTLGEDEYAYDVVLRLARRLLSHGATVYVIVRDPDDGIRGERILELDKDEVAYPDKVIPRSPKMRLRQRTDIVNKLFQKNKAKYRHQRLIITHVDSRSEGKNIDVFFYHDQGSKAGKALALQLQKTFEEKYAKFQPNRTYHGSVSGRELYVLKNTYPGAVFIELGNIRNKADQRRFVIKENREALANWICAGLITESKNLEKTDK